MIRSFAANALDRGFIAIWGFAAAAALVCAAGASAASAGTTPARERASYILFGPDKQGVTMSGSTDDLRRARALRVGGEALLYLRKGGTAYVVRDPATLREARLIFEPQQALGSQQAALGARQAELGRRQAALGTQQARLGAQQAHATPRQAVDLGRQQAALGNQQDALGQQQNALGQQQNELGRRQDRLAREADIKFRALLVEAIRRGLADPVR
ncbi:hypothetical protein [Sphingomonas sp.]|uniref:hypothetical protein n=1 Tax=Sphingomonas sp. TaxID=28214 RepID=UPI002DB84796|nr:hypothetical protein [Sphingomonas sp.]HEU4968677.1 hypothetical protein [Sphingomonas sp.]